MLLVQLTEIPVKGETGMSADQFEKSWVNPKNEHKHTMMEILRGYKEAFLQPQVMSVLMEHLADCLQMEVRNDKHDQMIELIIVLFKNLLQIPEPKATQQSSSFVGKDLQKKLLHTFSKENVLDSFNFLTQEFKQPMNQKLCMWILECHYQIIKNFTAEQVYLNSDKEQEYKQELYQE